MVCDAIRSDLFARPIKCLLAFSHPKYFRVQWFGGTLAAHPLKQCLRIGNKWHAPHCPILCAGFRVAAHFDVLRKTYEDISDRNAADNPRAP